MNDQRGGESVGARLKARRESRGMTLAQIAEITKIAKSAFDAIERDDIKRLPGGIFLRSFVRTYARELGLEPEGVVREFLAQFPDLEDQPGPRGEVHDQPPAQPRLSPGLQRAVALAGPAVALAVLSAWWLIGGRHDRAVPLDAERIAAVAPEVPAPAVTQVADVVRAGGKVEAPLEPPAVSLILTATARCWLSATSDGQPTVRRLVVPGERVELRADRELVLNLGDAGAVSLRLNGAQVRELGAAGEVVTVRFDPANLRDYLVH